MNTRRQMGTALGSTAWIRPAAFDRRVVHLRLADDSLVPSASDLETWIEQVRGDPSFSTIRTSALFPRAAERFAEAGFAVADTLALLRADLDQPSLLASLAAGTPDGASTASIRPHEYAAAARIDQAAFGREWGHDAEELQQVRHATPACQVRVRFLRTPRWRRGPLSMPVRSREVAAFAIAGASTEHGYLQRLSVDPAAQREGHGRALTLDALRWMARRRLRDCLVNTSIDNAAALALYESTGFRRMTEHLQVLELDLRG